MSQEEINRELRQLTASGKLPASVAREAMKYPIEGEKIVRLERLEQQNAIQSQKLEQMSIALFGNEDLQIPGLVGDVRFLKIAFWRGIWTVTGAVGLGTFLLTILGLVIAWNH